MGPVRRHQAAVIGRGKPVVNEQYNSHVLLCADDSPCSLEYLVHAGVAIGVVKPAAPGALKVVPQLFLASPHLGQSRPHHRCADQPVSGQVHPFPEHAAQHRKSQQRLCRVRDKTGKEFLPPGLVQGTLLDEHRDLGMTFLKGGTYFIQIEIAGEKSDIVAGPGCHHPRQVVGHPVAGGVPVTVAGADIAGTVEGKILLGEGAFQCHSPGLRQTAQVLIVGRRRQCSGKQHRRPPQGKVLLQKGAGIQAQLGQAHIAAEGRSLQYKMVVKSFGHPQPGPHIEIKLQERPVCLVGGAVFVQPGLQRLTQAVEQAVQFLVPVRADEGLGGTALLLTAVTPFQQGIVHLLDGSLEPAFPLAQQLFGRGELTFQQGFGMHVPGPVREIVGFIHQEKIISRRLKKAFEADHRVKQIVVVSNDDVTPQAQIQPHLKGADRMLLGRLCQCPGG